MSKEELEILRLKVKIEVLLMLVRGLYTGLANTSLIASATVRENFAEMRKEHSKIAIPNLPAGYSDLLAGEYQEALEDALSQIEAGIKF